MPGDEVILPSFTIVSCLGQILRKGAIPVFVDALPDTWNMDVTQIEELISPKTRGIIAVHIYGLPVDMDPLIEMAGRHGVPVIEDAAEAHGLLYKDRICGSMGLVSTFSFYANKNITTGEGGMILTDDKKLADKLRMLKNLSFLPQRRFLHENLGWNARLSSLQCALGTSQTSRLPEILQRRARTGEFYQNAFADIPNVRLPVRSVAYAQNNYWVFGMVLESKSSLNASKVMTLLDELGVGTRPFFHPLHTQPLLKKHNHKKQNLPVSEWLGENGFYIPNGIGISDSQIERVVNSVRDVLFANV
jgi:perosamine synthetase